MTRTLISAVALVAAMTFSGAGMAQTMVGESEVSAEDLPKVQSACDTLAAKEMSGSDTDPTDSTDDSSSGDTEAGIDAATTTSIDLALLNYEACKEAGLVQ